MKRLAQSVSTAALTLMAACATEPTSPLSSSTPRFETVPGVGSFITFEAPAFATGSINGQNGWTSIAACAPYDHAVSTLGAYWAVPGFGSQSLRISNAVTSGCFDGTFSKPVVDEAGEASAYVALPSGTRQPTFSAQWDFASTIPNAEQPGLSVVASPDKGDGGRMSRVQMTDTPTGIDVNFYDYQDALPFGSNAISANGRGPEDDFVFTNLATGLSRTVPHTIRIEMTFVAGPHNDIVKVYVDGALKHTGTSWEDYFRWTQGPGDLEQTAPVRESRVVRSLMFRTGGSAVPTNAGKGFLIDNVQIASGPTPVGPPTSAESCKNNGWKLFNNPVFKNQGDCVSYTKNGK